MGGRSFMASECKNGQFSAYCKICKNKFSVRSGDICLVLCSGGISVQKSSQIIKEWGDSSVFIIHYLYHKWFWMLSHYVSIDDSKEPPSIYRNDLAHKNSDEQVCQI